MQIIYFKVECLFPELLPSSTVTLKEVVLTRENEVISTFSNLKISNLPFYSFHLVPVGFRKIEHLIKGEPGKYLQFSSGYLQSGEYRVEIPTERRCLAMTRSLRSGGWLTRMMRSVISQLMNLFHAIFRLFAR